METPLHPNKVCQFYPLCHDLCSIPVVTFIFHHINLISSRVCFVMVNLNVVFVFIDEVV